MKLKEYVIETQKNCIPEDMHLDGVYHPHFLFKLCPSPRVAPSLSEEYPF